MADKFDVKLVEEAKYYSPPPEYKEKAFVRDYEKTYQQFLKDPEKFWDGIARELHWFAPWKKVLDWNYPYAKWFVDGKLNITYNCLDRHVYNHRKNK
ncbi:MAG: acetyl-coenzyme A synthetase, partial [Methanomicrobiales archaeon]|nr:acetyl-coenzyme A synthetase [Methanomicrobiales archaeon]